MLGKAAESGIKTKAGDLTLSTPQQEMEEVKSTPFRKNSWQEIYLRRGKEVESL